MFLVPLSVSASLFLSQAMTMVSECGTDGSVAVKQCLRWRGNLIGISESCCSHPWRYCFFDDRSNLCVKSEPYIKTDAESGVILMRCLVEAYGVREGKRLLDPVPMNFLALIPYVI